MVVAEAAYWAALRAGAGPAGAAQTLQPVTVVWAVPALGMDAAPPAAAS